MAQPGSAPALGAGSRRFKSSRPDQLTYFSHWNNLPLITVYVLKGETGKRYVGITNNLARRLQEHRSGKTKASQLLDEFIILHEEAFPDYNSARGREKFLKSGQGRKWLDELDL